ncbi:potassium transporter 5-like isoform X2 [Argentina anserina]|uniref:potassium transporter 5-like isoform X2 n=1 Tax=Argentina anserina TaxID=57926 RepID=UPI002176277D|nr:potassium transporter 5-like isoform X2 [Potentilla anserina]
MRRVDSLNIEAGKVSGFNAHRAKVRTWTTTLSLAIQSLGVVYGDIGTSPLYVYSSTFPNGIKEKDDILGVLSIIIYTILFVPMVKYVFIVLWANDNGEGGTFAMYSLICRYAKVSLIPNNQPEDRELSNYKLDKPSSELKRSQAIKKRLETSRLAQYVLFVITITGTSMVIGDGVLTPCISVLSAVSGLQSGFKGLDQSSVVWISVAILILLFAVQQFGTDKVGFTFAPIILLWFLFLTGTGIYNLFTHDITVLKAFNPWYIVTYFQRNGKAAWISLGGAVLCITGTEAMFADLGHFSVRAIQVSFTFFTFPTILFAYLGQSAYLSKHPEDVATTFYASIPRPIYWPTFVVAVLAAIIASQALITGAFSIIAQSLGMGCFPRVKIVHTSAKNEGQVYIPEINYILMIACVIITAGFETTEKIGNAYGIAVVSVMCITTSMITLIMLVIWKTSIFLIAIFFVVFIAIEGVYLSSVLFKFVEGGYLPLFFAAVLMVIMATWHYVHKQSYMFEVKNKVSTEYVKQLASNPDIHRLPGMGLLYSDLVQGIPPIFSHFISNIPSVHSVVVIVNIKSLPVSKVLAEERFIFRQLEPKEYRMFRCVARYGYNDLVEGPGEFERQLVDNLKEYIRMKHVTSEGNSSSSYEEEIQFVQEAMDKGVVYMMGEAQIVAEEKSSWFKRIVVNYIYDFLRKNSRQSGKIMSIPRTKLLMVGMTYDI